MFSKTFLQIYWTHAADTGYFLAMVTEGQVHVLNEGESVVLECSFHADGYSLFSYPVLWRKQQLDEDIQMNIMGNINEPFAASNRFEVAFTSLAPRYKFELSVLGKSRTIAYALLIKLYNQTVNDGVAHSKNPRKCAYHVTFDLDLDLEHTLDAC